MSPLALSLRFLQTQPDPRLIELARAGHERAFEALVQRYRRPLLGYCRQISPTGVSPEDVLQQALLQAWIAITGHDTDVREARAWLYRIAHNVAISMLRRATLEASHLELPEGENGADQEVERRIAAREALAGLASLPELQRELLLATALEGRSHDELATSLGLTHGAVRGLIYRARATLRAAAAVVVPAPLVNWAARQTVEQGSGSTALLETLGGGGSGGLGAVLAKGGAILVSAGALAGAAGIGSTLPSHRHRPAAKLGVTAGAQGTSSQATGSAGSGPAPQAAPAATAPLYASSPATSGIPRGGRGARPATFTFARIPTSGRTTEGSGSRRIDGGSSGRASSSGSGNGGGDGGSRSKGPDGSSGSEHGGSAGSGRPSASSADSGSGSRSGAGSASSPSGRGGSDGSAHSDDSRQSSVGRDHGRGGDGGSGPNGPVSTRTSTG